MDFENKLNGNWEEKGVIGNRIEINGSNITFLWQSGEVLKTTFTSDEINGIIELHLADNGLRYKGANSDYAAVERVYYENGRLHYIKNFPISGISENIMELTEKSRYGNITISDNLLAKIQGSWKDQYGHAVISIHDDQMTLDKKCFRIHAAVRPYRTHGEDFVIIHQDPAIHEIGYFSEMVYVNGTIRGYILICDVGLHEVIFDRVN